ncbi:hypothetical protein ACLB2K_040549 [Fragaria x ananassa]
MKSMGIDEREVEFGMSTLKNQLFELHDMYKDNVVQVVPTSSINSNLPTSSDSVIVPNDEDEDFAEWRSHEEVYHVLSLIARDLLSVPASMVASEAAFSAGRRVVSKNRASLSPSTIQAVICLKDWKLADVRQQDKEQDELRAKEEEIAKRARPEYMIALERPNANTDEVKQIAD